MKIAVSQLVAPGDMDMEAFADKAKATGYDGVELSLRPSNSPFTYETTDAQLNEFKQLFAQRNLEIFSTTFSAKSGNLLDSGTAAQEDIEQTIFGLEATAKLGSHIMLHTLGRFTADLYYEDAYNNGIANLKKLAQTAEKLKVAIAIEFVWSGFLFSPLEMRNFIEAIGSDYVGFYFDPGNMAVFQFPQHWVRALGKHTKHVHLKDWKGRALKGEWTPLTQGECNFPVIMRELRNAGYAGPLVSEVPESLAPWNQTAQTMRKIAEM
ncbi:MAG: sugar phosphate isomerase/epimerase [Victivallales bacterium]|nr:sugar phosphate isomerase/epimerase [Victivallales bacterium]